MVIEVSVTINATRAAVWALVADVANHASICSGIDKLEVLTKPASGLVGLKWRETRMYFGKPAAADKWITDAGADFYKTRAEDGGFVFTSVMRVSGTDGAVTLSTVHDSIPQTFGMKLMAIPMALFFKGVAKKALLADLNDIKKAAEGR
jgi:hypothetical protein